MYYFPLELFQSIIEFAIKSKNISKQKINQVRDFFKAFNNLPTERIKEIQKSDYISEIFSKDEFMELYALYINNNDKVIKDIFGEVSIVDIEEMKTDFDFLAELNSKMKKIIEKNAVFLVKAGPKNYLIVPFPFESYLYFDIKNLIGEYTVLLGYPYDIFEVCQKILLKIREKEMQGTAFVSSQDILNLFNTQKLYSKNPLKDRELITTEE
ncbi:MAG: hypothetical protein ACK4ZM_02195, partial [bacterium]